MAEMEKYKETNEKELLELKEIMKELTKNVSTLIDLG